MPASLWLYDKQAFDRVASKVGSDVVAIPGQTRPNGSTPVTFTDNKDINVTLDLAVQHPTAAQPLPGGDVFVVGDRDNPATINPYFLAEITNDKDVRKGLVWSFRKSEDTLVDAINSGVREVQAGYSQNQSASTMSALRGQSIEEMEPYKNVALGGLPAAQAALGGRVGLQIRNATSEGASVAPYMRKSVIEDLNNRLTRSAGPVGGLKDVKWENFGGYGVDTHGLRKYSESTFWDPTRNEPMENSLIGSSIKKGAQSVPSSVTYPVPFQKSIIQSGPHTGLEISQAIEPGAITNTNRPAWFKPTGFGGNLSPAMVSENILYVGGTGLPGAGITDRQEGVPTDWGINTMSSRKLDISLADLVHQQVGLELADQTGVTHGVGRGEMTIGMFRPKGATNSVPITMHKGVAPNEILGAPTVFIPATINPETLEYAAKEQGGIDAGPIGKMLSDRYGIPFIPRTSGEMRVSIPIKNVVDIAQRGAGSPKGTMIQSPTLGQAGRVVRKCRRAGRADTPSPSRSQSFPGTFGHQHHGQLAIDPFARSGSAPLRGGPRLVRHLGRGAQEHAVLGWLCDEQSGA